MSVHSWGDKLFRGWLKSSTDETLSVLPPSTCATHVPSISHCKVIVKFSSCSIWDTITENNTQKFCARTDVFQGVRKGRSKLQAVWQSTLAIPGTRVKDRALSLSFRGRNRSNREAHFFALLSPLSTASYRESTQKLSNKEKCYHQTPKIQLYYGIYVFLKITTNNTNSNAKNPKELRAEAGDCFHCVQWKSECSRKSSEKNPRSQTSHCYYSFPVIHFLCWQIQSSVIPAKAETVFEKFSWICHLEMPVSPNQH